MGSAALVSRRSPPNTLPPNRLALISKPTAKQSNEAARFRTAGGSRLKEFCRNGTKEQCAQKVRGPNPNPHPHPHPHPHTHPHSHHNSNPNPNLTLTLTLT